MNDKLIFVNLFIKFLCLLLLIIINNQLKYRRIILNSFHDFIAIIFTISLYKMPIIKVSLNHLNQPKLVVANDLKTFKEKGNFNKSHK